MEFPDEVAINASPQQVYAALNDIDVSKRCIPGCEELERLSDTEPEARVVLRDSWAVSRRGKRRYPLDCFANMDFLRLSCASSMMPRSASFTRRDLRIYGGRNNEVVS
ncbi:SRPBCC domain-containing protein [Bradyrhizobium iriomotense]|uniref:Uncharacterized protein n=1 Tax=Bradyrhizobium iriomotense TaxID=441950 RepID=A0ABQ6BBU1_9BRAD|nr:SRPBCC domain-containing protein [Bradyrhizobium iriomotense]GLR91854.1 hypothetical protein GCM10007857_85720 [Bradyrhizobium iriomotense]